MFIGGKDGCVRRNLDFAGFDFEITPQELGKGKGFPFRQFLSRTPSSAEVLQYVYMRRSILPCKKDAVSEAISIHGRLIKIVD
jgi:hypothetical protein